MKILAVDYGDSRTGLATCDHTEFLTTPITPQITLKARNKVAARVCEVAKEIEAELIVIGLPLNMASVPQKAASWQRPWSFGAACRCACGTSARPPAPPPTCWTRAAPLAAAARRFWIPSAPR